MKEKVISQVTSVQVLVFGNSSREQTVEFCKENIVKKFETVEAYHGVKATKTKLSCIYTETSLGTKAE